MNFEHLYKKLSKKYPSNKKKLILLFEHFRIKNLLLQKLKLGLISFELKEFFFAGFKIYEVIEMRYSRQDNTFTDSLKLENRLKSLSWKWDFSNIIALIMIFLFVFLFVYVQIDYWFEKNLPSIVNNDSRYELLLNYTLKNLFVPSFNFPYLFKNINIWLIETITNFCDIYDILS